MTLTINTASGASSNIMVTWVSAPGQPPEDPPAAEVSEPRRPSSGAPPMLVAHKEPDGCWAVAS